MKKLCFFILVLSMILTTACKHIDDFIGLGNEKNDGIEYIPPDTTEELEMSNDPISMDMWELTETILIEPETYEIGDDMDNTTYTFESSQNSIHCMIDRSVYNGKSKPYLEEKISMTGNWTSPALDAYLPDETIKLTLSASIDLFERLSSDLDKNGTNHAGVNVWAYITNFPDNDLKNPEGGYLVGTDGISTATAEIYEGEISEETKKTIEVKGTFGKGNKGDIRALCIVVSSNGRIGGIKYIYKYIE